MRQPWHSLSLIPLPVGAAGVRLALRDAHRQQSSSPRSSWLSRPSTTLPCSSTRRTWPVSVSSRMILGTYRLTIEAQRSDPRD